jgi:hypothetical protein
MRAVVITSMVLLIVACGAPPIEDNLDTDDVKLPDRNPVTYTADAGPNDTDGGGGPETSTLTVTLTGAGTGAVTSTPSGLACTGKTCTGSFARGTAVTLAAAPGAGSLFGGWGGACTGAAACAPQIAGNVAVTADFGSLDGTWSGTYTNARTAFGCNFTNAGNLNVTVKAGAALSSAASMTGLQLRSIPSCNVTGSTTGAAPDSALTMATDTLTGTWTFAVASGGTLAFPFTAKVVDKKLTGTWTCPTCTGSFTLTKP